jgi:hypothetical protein
MTRYWQGRMRGDRRNWEIEVTKSPAFEPDGPRSSSQTIEAIRGWLERSDQPAFAVWVEDSDYAYVGVGADRSFRGEVFFTAESAKRSGISVSTDAVIEGANAIAEWAREHAPMWTLPSVIEALARAGGDADGAIQLLRVLAIDLTPEGGHTLG